jgi:hypothetical protein
MIHNCNYSYLLIFNKEVAFTSILIYDCPYCFGTSNNKYNGTGMLTTVMG